MAINTTRERTVPASFYTSNLSSHRAATCRQMLLSALLSSRSWSDHPRRSRPGLSQCLRRLPSRSVATIAGAPQRDYHPLPIRLHSCSTGSTPCYRGNGGSARSRIRRVQTMFKLAIPCPGRKRTRWLWRVQFPDLIVCVAMTMLWGLCLSQWNRVWPLAAWSERKQVGRRTCSTVRASRLTPSWLELTRQGRGFMPSLARDIVWCGKNWVAGR